MSSKKYGVRDAKAFKESFAEAERKLTVKNRPEGGVVQLKPSAIKIRPELFQTRRLNLGTNSVDPDWVKKLQRRIEAVGELDPPVVVKIGDQWVCVDGHHRIEAYKRKDARKQIRCDWFGGDLKEAVEEALRLNSRDRLNLEQKDRTEAAWKLVLLGKHSKAEIAKCAGVGERTVGNMRALQKLYDEDHTIEGNLFRRRLDGVPLEQFSWALVRMAYAGVKPEERSEEQAAETLARSINSRLTNKLSKDPKITARALELYNRELPSKLMEEWERRKPGTGPLLDEEAHLTDLSEF